MTYYMCMFIEYFCAAFGAGPCCSCPECVKSMCQCDFCIGHRQWLIVFELPPGQIVRVDAGRCLVYVHYAYIYSH